ncbi:MAG: glycosyltransferase family 39 protein [Burkholderiales bacterium]
MVSTKTLWALAIILAIIWFGPIDYRRLAKPDEARYAEISREMAASGDWITPHLNDLKYFEKPPLQYWATAAAFEVFGLSEGPARLWTALTGFAGVLLTYFTGRQLFGRQQGFYAASVLASSLWYALLGHINTLDMGLTFFLTLSVFGLSLAQREHAKPHQQRNWMLIAWLGMAMAVLSKGLIGIVLPGAALALYSILNRDVRIWTRLHLGKGALLFLLIAAPWFIAVSRANPEFAQFFFIHEHFDRFAKNEHDREGPIYYFVPILVIGILPWLVALFPALLRSWKIERGYGEYRFHPNRFLLVWCAFIFVFFSLSKSKLPAYLLPIFPALALFIGQYLDAIPAKKLFWQIFPVSLAALALTAAIPFILQLLPADDPAPNVASMNLQYAYWLMVAFGAMFIGVTHGLRLLTCDNKVAGLTAVSFAALITWQLAWMGYETQSPLQSSYDIAQKIRPYLKADTPIYSIGTYDQPLPYYLQRTVTLVNYQDELALGIKQEPHKWIPTVEEFLGKWYQDDAAIALMPTQVYQKLRNENLLMQVIADDGRRVIIKKP